MRPLFAAGAAILTIVTGSALAVWTFGVPLKPIVVPEGPYGVGSIDVLFTDPSRPEVFTEASLPRRVPAQVLYPIAKAASARAPYLAHAPETLRGMSRNHGGLLAASLQGLARLQAPWSTARAPAVARRLPVIFYLPGASGYREMNSYQSIDLAAHGYVVISLDQPGAVAASVLPDGTVINGLDRAAMESAVRPEYLAGTQGKTPPLLARWRSGQRSLIPYFAADASLALDQLALLNTDPRSPLAGKLDTSRAGIFGMSLGAIVAARVCADDHRFSACLMIDAATPTDVARTGLRQPALWLTRDAHTMRQERRSAGGWPEHEIAITQESIRDAASHSDDAEIIKLPGVFHLSFTDLAAMTPLIRWLGLVPDIDARATHRKIAMLTRGFFDQKLKGANNPRPARAGAF